MAFGVCKYKRNDIYLILKNLNPEKAHGRDDILIKMIQHCGKAIIESLRILFLSFLDKGVYPDDWKKSNVVPIHKEIKNLNIDRLVSLLSSAKCLKESFLTPFSITPMKINECQSGFLPGDSCTSQPLSITHKIYKAFDCNPLVDVRGTFLDISKSFEKVWHDSLIYKLKSYGVENKLLNLILLNGRISKWTNILAGVPQGFVLGPLFFLIYINDLSDGLKLICKIFADDTSLSSNINDIIQVILISTTV